MTYYTIKPLEWKKDSGFYIARALGSIYTISRKSRGWFWSTFDDCGNSDSVAHGKQLAEAHYRSRLLSALEPVEEKP